MDASQLDGLAENIVGARAPVVPGDDGLAASALQQVRSPFIHCSSGWHLRGNPRAFLIYDLALRLTDGGKSAFYLSNRQLAKYFGWDVKTVRAAFVALRKSGLFKLLRSGRRGRRRPQRRDRESRF